MDLGSSIIGAIAVAMCTVPFVIMYFKRRNKQDKKLQMLKQLAQEQSCTISQFEFCGDFLIGMDVNRNFVFFLKQKKEETITRFIDLSDVEVCQAVKKTRIIDVNEKKETLIDRVELQFLPRAKNNMEISLELYDDHVNNQLDGEIQFGDKWSKQINDTLQTNASVVFA